MIRAGCLCTALAVACTLFSAISPAFHVGAVALAVAGLAFLLADYVLPEHELAARVDADLEQARVEAVVVPEPRRPLVYVDPNTTGPIPIVAPLDVITLGTWPTDDERDERARLAGAFEPHPWFDEHRVTGD